MEEKKFSWKLFEQEEKEKRVKFDLNLSEEGEREVKFDLKYFMQDENIVKKTCKELGITQKELAELMGVSEGTVNRWSANPSELTIQATKMLALLVENHQLKQQQQDFKTFFDLFKKLQN
jgi:DNA-binding transcriptional regulator YiaG